MQESIVVVRRDDGVLKMSGPEKREKAQEVEMGRKCEV